MHLSEPNSNPVEIPVDSLEPVFTIQINQMISLCAQNMAVASHFSQSSSHDHYAQDLHRSTTLWPLSNLISLRPLPCLLCYSQTALCWLLKHSRKSFCSWVFVPASLSACNVLQGILAAKVLTSFKSLSKGHLPNKANRSSILKLQLSVPSPHMHLALMTLLICLHLLFISCHSTYHLLTHHVICLWCTVNIHVFYLP